MRYVQLAIIFFPLVACKDQQRNSGEYEVAVDAAQHAQTTFATQNTDAAPVQHIPDTTQLTTIQFADTFFNFGTMKSGEKKEHTFYFSNTGKSPLYVYNAVSTCGCTVPYYSTEPVMPGKQGNLKVQFDSRGKSGLSEKKIIVSINAFPARKVLRIKADVTK